MSQWPCPWDAPFEEYLRVAERGKQVREFETGATRDTDVGKPDYEGFLSPIVIERFGRYMNKHRLQSDGSIRDSDNWQKGIPIDVYMKSAWRHFMDVWLFHRSGGSSIDVEESLCALLFNVQGYLHEHLKSRGAEMGRVTEETKILRGLRG